MSVYWRASWSCRYSVATSGCTNVPSLSRLCQVYRECMSLPHRGRVGSGHSVIASGTQRLQQSRINQRHLPHVRHLCDYLTQQRHKYNAKGANKADRKPPFCCRIRRLLVTAVFLLAMARRSDVFLCRRTFSRGVNRTVPVRILCAHSQSALISSASAYSRIAFLSFVLCVLFNSCRQRTCLFTSLDISLCSTPPLPAD